MTCLVVLAGCGGSPQITATRHQGPVPNPTWTPLPTAEPASVQPEPLVGLPSLDEVEQAAQGGAGRLAGETFALHVAHILTDVRLNIAGRVILDEVASRVLDPAVRRYLIDDIDGQRGMHSERGMDTHLAMWLRSNIVGPSDEPTRVDVEVAFNVTSAPLAFAKWTGARYDVAREHGIWKLVGYSDALSGPFTEHELTRAQQRQFLTGPGWRRIPPANSSK